MKYLRLLTSLGRLLLVAAVVFGSLAAHAATNFPNVLSVGPLNSAPAYFYINTKIPFNSGVAPQIHITGYMYSGTNKALDVTIGWYMWNNAFLWTQYQSSLSFAKPSRIRLGTYDDAGTTRVRIEIANDGVYWTSYFVSATDILGYDPYYTGWTYVEGTMPATTGLITEVPLQGDVQIFGNLTANNFNNGTITGSTSGLNLNAGGTDKNITLSTSGVGKVGIGKVPDTFKLDVAGAGNGNYGVRLTPDYGLVRFNGIDLLGYPSQTLWEISNSSAAEFVLGTTWNWDNQVALSYTPGAVGSAGGIFSIGQTNKNNANYTHGATRLYTNGLERVRIDAAGMVGIGTPAPGAKLHVAGTGSMKVDPDEGSIELASGNDGMSFIDFKGSTNLAADYRGRMLYADGTGFIFSTGQSYTNELVIREGGNVGIGTTNPGLYKLAVNGTIHAKEIIVDNTNWADYVFDESYALAPLSDVEAHIKAKKHLPGIPSAAEIAEHGVSMGDMQSKLLSKIEELTLHMIQMEKENTALRQRVQKLEATPATP